jgi:hypothetical protein
MRTLQEGWTILSTTTYCSLLTLRVELLTVTTDGDISKDETGGRSPQAREMIASI